MSELRGIDDRQNDETRFQFVTPKRWIPVAPPGYGQTVHETCERCFHAPATWRGGPLDRSVCDPCKAHDVAWAATREDPCNPIEGRAH